jgi:hypothetical protein
MERKSEEYGPAEAKRRFEAALRGARAASAMPMKEIPPKRITTRGSSEWVRNGTNSGTVKGSKTKKKKSLLTWDSGFLN